VPKGSQFDDRIRNLIALAKDESEHSRSLLFSHICDLFLQKRPMASATQRQMLTEILKELLAQVTLSVRQDVASTLCTATSPPEELINIMCEDVVEVSGPLLEKAILPDEKLIHIIRYGTEAHRIHISRRFGLSPLVRHELEKAYQQSQGSKLKYSLSELDKQAEDPAPDLDEETTANILELLRAQHINSPYPEQQLEKADTIISEESFPRPEAAPPANDAAPTESPLSDSVIHMTDRAPEQEDDIWQQVEESHSETIRQREFVRTAADWFWEVDREGFITFLSDEAFTVFGQPSSSLVGTDFMSLCSVAGDQAEADNDNGRAGQSLDALFERRSSFRNIPFYITDNSRQKTLWYISAIAVFDIHTGRFTGFRGSARAEIPEEIPEEPHSTDIIEDTASSQEQALENYVATQALKAFSHERATTTKTEACNEEIAAELLQNLSHEFRTPLNAIIGFSEMINMETWGPVNPQYHHNIKNILAAAFQLKEAVNDVLDSARLEAGLMQITPESFSLKSVLKDCRKNVEAMASEKHLHFPDSDDNIDVILYNDIQSVELCLTKMLTSTIKRADEGETVTLSVLINSNGRIRIEMPILGPGIAEKDAEKIFQKLETAPDTQQNNRKSDHKYQSKISSGFGLSIAQSLAHLIGGDISTHSAEGYLTHLVLTLSNHEPSHNP